jgi:lysophospholipase L1-like esterase
MQSPSTNVYLFTGDGLTEGSYGESYVDRIARSLYRGTAGLTGQAVNAGRAAETVQSLDVRLAALLREYQPQWVVLAVGASDVWVPWLSSHSVGWWLWRQYRRARANLRPTTDLDQFSATYRALIDQSQHAGARAGARVLACTSSPLGERIATPPNRLLARTNGAIKQVAAERGVLVADVWQAFVEEYAVLPKPSKRVPGEWLFAWVDRGRLRRTTPDRLSQRRRLHLTFDGLHLNSRGADLWASTILRALALVQPENNLPR